MHTVKTLASEAYKSFERKTRDHGANFWTLKDGHPEWVKDIVYAAQRDEALEVLAAFDAETREEAK